MTQLTISNNRLFFGNKPMCFQEDNESVLSKLGNIGKEILNDETLVTQPVMFNCFYYNCLIDFQDGYLGNITLVPVHSKGMSMEETEELIKKAISGKYQQRSENVFFSRDIEIKMEKTEDELTLSIYEVEQC